MKLTQKNDIFLFFKKVLKMTIYITIGRYGEDNMEKESRTSIINIRRKAFFMIFLLIFLPLMGVTCSAQINAEDYLDKILPNAASNGYFHIVVFLYSIQQTHIDKHLFPIRFPLRDYDDDDICECDDNYEYCADNEFRYIYHDYYYDEWEDAHGGYFEVYKEDVKYVRSKTFIAACESGHLEIAQWIWEMEPDHVYIHDIEQFFVDICVKTQIHVAKWLISAFPSLLNKMEFMFPRICYYSRTKPETIEWLVQIYPSLKFSKIYSPYNHFNPNLIQKLSEFNITCAKKY